MSNNNKRLELAPTTTKYVVSRPVNVYPKLPVHVNRVTNYHKFDYDEQGKAFMSNRERVVWIGSFATEELAQGAIINDKQRRVYDVN